MRRVSTIHKLTLLLAFLSTLPAFLMVVRGVRQKHTAQTENRIASCQQLALGAALNLRDQDYIAIGTLVDEFVASHLDVRVRLVRFDGLVVHQTHETFGSVEEVFQPPESSGDIRIPLNRNGRQWGTLQAVYVNPQLAAQLWTYGRPLLATFLMNMFSFGLLLRRALTALDTGKAVPKRVRNTLDTIAGGVVILDCKRRIVMANEAFQKSLDSVADEVLGKSLDKFGFADDANCSLPWDAALDSRERQAGATIFRRVPGAEPKCFVVNATPIFGAQEKLAGTLVSFEDVTVLEQQKQTLIQAMSELETSKDEIRRQNLRLQELASRDALTGTFNRRSLFEQFEKLWGRRDEDRLACIMLDVDHFKKLNDNHGHAVGDQVLRDVARTIRDNVQEPGFVGRYGGEEFCVILPDVSAEQASEVGEQIRQAIESNLARPYQVTASFGVSGSELGAVSYQSMLEQADQALYHAKDNGRNAVSTWHANLESAVDNLPPALSAEPPKEDQPISYHAVASLHAALAYRDADTALHSQRVAELAVSMGRGIMSVGELYVLEIAGILHDIGKVGVPDSILLKPGKLTEEEWRVMEAHARMGVEIVDSSFDSPQLSDIVKFHHYRFDGTNTPEGGPVGKDIPLGARIVCIVDAFDAMVSNRVYRKGRPVEQAFEELRRCAGTQFDPDLVERFIDLKTGWRPDSRYFQSDFDDRLAVSVGHLTERTLYAYESRDREALRSVLAQLEWTGQQCDLPAVSHLSARLRECVETDQTEVWEDCLPILQDLLEMCMTVQRAHIREVASRPQLTENCPQQAYYSTARSWELETVSTTPDDGDPESTTAELDSAT